MFDDLKGLKKQFKMNRGIERQKLLSYMYSHGYTRFKNTKKRVSYLLESEEFLGVPDEFLTRYGLVRGMVESYEWIYVERYTDWANDNVIIVLGKPVADGSGICNIIKIKCEPYTRTSVSSVVEREGSVWIRAYEDVRRWTLNH